MVDFVGFCMEDRLEVICDWFYGRKMINVKSKKI